MGGTLTLLARHLVRQEVVLAGWRVASLYGVNTLVASCGCFLTDFALVPSVTALLDQRYMRALAHIPLLSMERPSRVLVIGFGAGNSTHAATLHPSVERVEVADLSRHVLLYGYASTVGRRYLSDISVRRISCRL